MDATSRTSTDSLSRRSVLGAAAVTGLAAVVAGLSPAAARAQAEAEAIIKKNNINQTVCRWCYAKTDTETLFAAAAKMGYKGVDLVGPADWPLLKKYNLLGTMTPSHKIE